MADIKPPEKRSGLLAAFLWGLALSVLALMLNFAEVLRMAHAWPWYDFIAGLIGRLAAGPILFVGVLLVMRAFKWVGRQISN